MSVKSSIKVYIIFLIAALLCAIGYAMYMHTEISPFKLWETDKQVAKPDRFVFYHDFEGDANSERLQIINEPAKRAISVEREIDTFVDQFPFTDSLRMKENWYFFGDFTQDGVDELFAFTQSEDSLFLTIIDINPSRYIQHRKFMLTASPQNPYYLWDLEVVAGGLLDTDHDGVPEFIFSAISGYSQYPRGVYIYDIEERAITNRFESAAPVTQLWLEDLNGDDTIEIIGTSGAPGNIDKSVRYTDSKSWLFMFDQNLSFVYPPRSFGEYPGGVISHPIKITNKWFLLLLYSYNGSKDLPSHLYLVNSAGRVETERTITKKTLGLYTVFYQENSPLIYLYSDVSDEFFVVNEKLEILQNKSQPVFGTNTDIVVQPPLIHMNTDGIPEIIVRTPTGLDIIDHNLSLLATH